jgi:hypothetical protein
LELKHEKDVEKSLKSALRTTNFSDLSFGTSGSHFQSQQITPLSCHNFSVFSTSSAGICQKYPRINLQISLVVSGQLSALIVLRMAVNR